MTAHSYLGKLCVCFGDYHSTPKKFMKRGFGYRTQIWRHGFSRKSRIQLLSCIFIHILYKIEETSFINQNGNWTTKHILVQIWVYTCGYLIVDMYILNCIHIILMASLSLTSPLIQYNVFYPSFCFDIICCLLHIYKFSRVLIEHLEPRICS